MILLPQNSHRVLSSRFRPHFYCYLKSLPDCAVRDPVQICEGKGSRAPGRLHRWNFGHRDYLVAGKQKLFCSAHTQMYLGPGPCRTRLSHDDPSGLLRLWQKSGTGCRKQTLQAAIPFRTPCVATSAARGSRIWPGGSRSRSVCRRTPISRFLSCSACGGRNT